MAVILLAGGLLLLGHAGLGQLGGWLVGPALGYRPFSFHIAGTLVGCGVTPDIGELWTWAIYNFVVFAVMPHLWFRRRYSATQLNLRSTNRTNDLLVIVAVAVIESLVALGEFPGIFQLNARQLLIAAPLAFGILMIGTVLPTMVLIYAILIPRYLKLTGSGATTVILGGVTYAAMHIVEGWSVFTTPRDIAVSARMRSSNNAGRRRKAGGRTPDHSGRPAFRRPSSILARSDGRRGIEYLMVAIRSPGSNCRRRTIAFSACSCRPRKALLAAATRHADE